MQLLVDGLGIAKLAFDPSRDMLDFMAYLEFTFFNVFFCCISWYIL